MNSELGFRSQLELLRDSKISISWGVMGKGFLNLARELYKGESILVMEDDLRRKSSIACVYVFYQSPEGKSLQLIESAQVFKSGQVICRNFEWLSEKGLKDESPEMTGYRALKEELGLDIATSSRLVFRQELVKSDSANPYPELSAEMHVTDYEITLSDSEYEDNMIDLPSGEVVYGFKETQKEKAVYFLWREV